MPHLKVKIRRVRFLWRLTKAYFNKYKFRVVLTLAALIFILLILNFIFPSISQKNTINIGIVGNYTLDKIPAEILSLATDSLISTDQSGKPKPLLASNWTISEDNKTYVLFLKDNV